MYFFKITYNNIDYKPKGCLNPCLGLLISTIFIKALQFFNCYHVALIVNSINSDQPFVRTGKGFIWEVYEQ